mgnify:CR=1 FL=1
MTALQVSSENKSIPTDTLVYYTRTENRKIAVLLEERNYYKEAYHQDSTIISEIKYIVIEKDKQLYNTSVKLTDLEALHKSLAIDFDKLSNKNKSLNRANKNLTIWGLSTTASTILLLVIIFI